MSARDSIRDLLHRDPFEPFRVVTTSGESYIVRNPDLVALTERRLFVAEPRSDRWALVEYLHITAVEHLANGRRNGHPRRGRRKRRG